MTRARGRKVQLTQDAAAFLHRSCKHVTDDEMVVIFDAEGIVRIQRPADKRELANCSPLELLCLEHR